MLKIDTKTSRKNLVQAWRTFFKTREPNKAGSRVLLNCLQVKKQRQGHIADYNIAEVKLLSRLKRHKTGAARLEQKASLPIGSELIRKYRGRTYLIRVNSEGFEWAGKPYSSLSRIAHEITGSRRSGPKFFGLSG